MPAVLLVLALLAGCGDDVPEDARRIDDYSTVGDCLRQDGDDPETFRQAGCGDGATVEIVAMVDGNGPASPVCPEGTDVVVDGQQGPIDDGDITGVAQTWCLRNLAPPHPGDPGVGGGELVQGDCFSVETDGSIAEAPCDGSGAVVPRHRLLARVPTAGECPDGTAEPIDLNSSPVEVLCAGTV
jgi:hypothetical protein